MSMKESDILDSILSARKKEKETPNPYLKEIMSVQDRALKYDPLALTKSKYEFNLGQSGGQVPPIDFSIVTGAGKEKKPKGENPFITLLSALNGVVGFIPNQIYNWTDGKADYKDIPIIGGQFDPLKVGLKSQKDAWKNGVFDWNDIPGIGLLAGMGKTYKTGKDILVDNLGAEKWKDVKYSEIRNKDKPWYSKENIGKMFQATDWVDVLGLGIDIVADPTTYLTFGATGAVKASRAAASAATKSTLDDLVKQGVSVVGKVDNSKAPNQALADVVEASIENKMKQDFSTQVGKSFDEYSKDMDALRQQVEDPNLRPAGFDEASAKSALDSFDETFSNIRKESQLKAQEAFNFVDNKMKEARLSMQDKLISIDIPFTDFVKSFGKKPKIFTKLDRTIDTVGETAVRNTLKFLGFKDLKQMDEVAKRLYGTEKISGMTLQASKHFQKTIQNFNQKLSNNILKALHKAGTSESVAAEVTRVLNNYSFKNQLGENISKVLSEIDPANIRFSTRQNDALINDQLKLYTDEMNALNIIPLDDATLRNMMMQGLDPNNLNVMKAHQNLLKGLREQLTASNAPPEQLAILDKLKLKFQEQVKVQREQIIKDLEPTLKNIANDVDTEVSAFRSALLGQIDPNNPIQKELNDLTQKRTSEEEALTTQRQVDEDTLVEQRRLEEESLTKEIARLDQLAQDLKKNKSKFASITEFSTKADELYTKLIDGQTTPKYAEYNDSMVQLIQSQFNFKNIELKDQKTRSKVDQQKRDELLYNGVHNVATSLKMLSQYGFKQDFSDLDLVFDLVNGNTKALASYRRVGYNVKQILINNNGEASFIHEFMHYLDDTIHRAFHDTYFPNKGDYQNNLKTGDSPLGGIWAKGSKNGFYKEATITLPDGTTKTVKHPFHDIAKDLFNNNDFVKNTKANKGDKYIYQDIEIMSRFLSRAMYQRLSLAQTKGLKLDQNFTDHLKNYASKKSHEREDIYTAQILDDVLNKLDSLFEGYGLKQDVKVLKTQERKVISDQKKNINKNIKGLDAKYQKQLNDVEQKYQTDIQNLQQKYDPDIAKAQAKLAKFESDVPVLQREFVTANRFQQDITNRRLTRSKYWNPHSLSSKQNFTESFGKAIAEAETMTYGEKVWMQNNLREIDKATKEFTQDELAVIPYLLQNAFPRGMTKDQFLASRGVTNVAKVENIVKKMADTYEELGVLEQEIGAIVRLGENYFPHVYTKPDAEALAELERLVKDFPDDPLVKELMGRSQKLGFDKARRSFQTLADLDDYIDKVDDQIRNATDPDQIALLEGKKTRLEGLIERNPINAMAIRMSRSIRARVNKQLYDNFERNSMLVRKKNLSNVSYDKSMMKTLEKEEARLLGLEPGDLINKEIFDGLKKIDGLLKDDKIDRILQQIDSVQSIWKQVITSLVPKYYVYNLIGNIFNNALAGVSMSSYREAASLVKRIKTKKLTPQDKKLFNNAIQDGVINQGFLTDMSKYFKNLDPNEAYQPTYGQRFQEFVGEKTKNIPVLGTEKLSYKRNLEKVGEYTDDFTRLANYIDNLKKTGSRELARASVAKYLFNYRELSRGDRYIRQLLPFWTWTRNNIPLQLEKLFTEPRFALTWLKIKREMQGELEDEDVPDWILESSFMIGDKAFDPRLPMTDLNMIFKNTPPELFSEWMGMMNPVVKNVIELSMNKKFFNQRPIYYGETPAQDYTAYALQQLGQFGSTTANLLFKDEPNIPEEIAKIFTPVPREIPGR